jgi:hypothetical protein
MLDVSVGDPRRSITIKKVTGRAFSASCITPEKMRR